MDTVKYCVLEDDTLCTGCHECDRCDLNPDKTCDNCMKCIQIEDADYAEVVIDEIMGEDDGE